MLSDRGPVRVREDAMTLRLLLPAPGRIPLVLQVEVDGGEGGMRFATARRVDMADAAITIDVEEAEGPQLFPVPINPEALEESGPDAVAEVRASLPGPGGAPPQSGPGRTRGMAGRDFMVRTNRSPTRMSSDRICRNVQAIGGLRVPESSPSWARVHWTGACRSEARPACCSLSVSPPRPARDASGRA
jgi:hypothetical protein